MTCLHLHFRYEHIRRSASAMRRRLRDMSAIAIRLQFSYYHTQGVPLPQLTLQRRLHDLSAIAIRLQFSC